MCRPKVNELGIPLAIALVRWSLFLFQGPVDISFSGFSCVCQFWNLMIIAGTSISIQK